MEGSKLVKIEQLQVQDSYTQQQILDVLTRLAANPGALERLLRCADRLPEVERVLLSFETRCQTTISRADAVEQLCRDYMCPGNVNYSQRTLDEYSEKSQVKLNVIVKDLGDPYVNAYPVPPGKKIRLTHQPRPGYTPTSIRVDLNIANNGNNYSDFTFQFFLSGHLVGDAYDGNMFLNKDGTQIQVPFPTYRNEPNNVGSLETLSVEITNNGAANNLQSAHININYDNTRFYEQCKARSCGGGCSNPPM